MKNLNKYDQFFLLDYSVVEKLVEAAGVKKDDVVLEIGSGKGVVTQELARQARKVVAVEIDQSLVLSLKKLPKNVKVVFGNALFLMDKIKYNKIVASLPSSIIEPLFKILTQKKFDLMAALIPLKFVGKLQGTFFSVYFETELLEKVGPKSFDPQPKTNWALVRIIPQADPLKQKDYSRFVRKYLLEHPEAKLKNSLMEAGIAISKNEGKEITKNQAREIVNRLQPTSGELEEKLTPATNIYNLSETFSRLIIP